MGRRRAVRGFRSNKGWPSSRALGRPVEHRQQEFHIVFDLAVADRSAPIGMRPDLARTPQLDEPDASPARRSGPSLPALTP